MEYLIQNWEQAFNDTFYLYEQIKQSDFSPQIIVGIARGGWIPARLLADFFAIKVTANIKVEAYQMMGEMDVEAKITQDVSAPVSGKDVLIVDDIADTGSSLQAVIKQLEKEKCKEIKIATLYFKDKSIIKPDYFVNKTDAWVIFSWEYFESIKDLTQMWESENLSKDEMIQQLKSIGIPASIVNTYFSEFK